MLDRFAGLKAITTGSKLGSVTVFVLIKKMVPLRLYLEHLNHETVAERKTSKFTHNTMKDEE